MSQANGKKIAILGGGIGSLAAAFALSEAPQPYQITVYQMGWRVGGKGASGRNMAPEYHERIEEHGLHVWSGIYENAFRVLRQCYAELGRAPDAPLATWQDAYKPANFFVVEELYKGRWVHWPITIPENSALPGEPNAELALSLWQYLGEALDWMRDQHAAPAAAKPSDSLVMTAVRSMVRWAERVFRALNLRGLLLWVARQLARFKSASVQAWGQRWLLWLLHQFMQRLWRKVASQIDNDDTRRRWIMLNFAYANLRGALENDVFSRGFDILDDQDYRDWLGTYAYPDAVDGAGLTVNSPLAWFLYDAIFAYRAGDLNQPDLAAGVALRTLVRMAFTYKGALIWKMQAGMGDTVFTPLYEVLRRRGVRFEFFQRVDGLHLAADGQTIDAITLGRQAWLHDEQREYQPLVMVKGLACWPSTPLYAQLRDGETWRDINFESTNSPTVETRRLIAGHDFDHVVLGISLGGLPRICGELVAAKPAWAQMLANITTVRTQAAQLWLKPTASQLGWSLLGEPLLATYRVNPLDTWADMSHLIEREGWPTGADRYPLNIAYFCGPMLEGADDPAVALAATRRTAHDLLTHHIGHLWPRSTTPPNTTTAPLDWNLLIDDRSQPAHGADRLAAQYLRANIEGSERYVQSTAGSLKYRLQPRASGCRNLVLAGDWTDNSMNQGNIEATVMSGLLAANAISGFPTRRSITGVDFGRSGTRGRE